MKHAWEVIQLPHNASIKEKNVTSTGTIFIGDLPR